MIRLQRSRTLQAVASAFTGDGLRDNSLWLLRRQRTIKRGRLARHKFNPVWTTAKQQLFRETHGKCAYCESPTAVVWHGDVDHYRPKAEYWWLAYCLDNFLVSCSLCNNSKLARFPCEGTRMAAPRVAKNSTDAQLRKLARKAAPDPLDRAAVAAFEELHVQERPLLINPYFDDPASYFAWRADDVLGEVELIPRDAESERYVVAADGLCRLNRLELKRQRFRWLSVCRTLLAVLSTSRVGAESRTDAADMVSRMQEPDQPYAGMIRFFCAAGTESDWVRGGFLVS